MTRISTNLPNDSMQFYLRERTRAMLDVQENISAQTRIGELRDDPIAAAHATRYRSVAVRLERFADNAQTVIERNQLAEGYLRQATDIFQRSRELAVQTANGTYTREDLAYAAAEVDQLLEELVQIGNARGADGTMLFAGDRTEQTPFRALRGADPDAARIHGVVYTGTTARLEAEVGEGIVVEAGVPGNEAFWAENQQIRGARDVTAFQIDEDTTIRVSGVEIALRAGDTATTVATRINTSGAPVRASIDSVTNAVTLETTAPHQIWLEDANGVLEEMGLVSAASDAPPNNIAIDAQVSGGSGFDTLIALRDALLAGDQEAVGGSVLGRLDRSLSSLLGTTGRLGALNNRLEGSARRNEMEQLDVLGMASRQTDIDLAASITELRMLEYTHRAALSVSARVLQTSLLDFLR